MQAKDYDAWYQTPRGSWIGEQERALAEMVRVTRKRMAVVVLPELPRPACSSGR